MNIAVMRAVPRYRRWPGALASIAAAVLVGVASAEVMGWPFLAEPMQRWLTQTLQRDVDFTVDGHTPASVRVRLLGQLRIEAPLVRMGAAAGGPAQTALRAHEAVITLSYRDLWRARGGEPLRIHDVAAAELQTAEHNDIQVANTSPCASCAQVHADLTM